MDPISVILPLIVIVCMIVLIRYLVRQKKREKEVVIPAPVVTSTVKESAVNESAAPEPIVSNHNTIYAFYGKNNVRRCPFCDAENSVGTVVCSICGRDL